MHGDQEQHDAGVDAGSHRPEPAVVKPGRDRVGDEPESHPHQLPAPVGAGAVDGHRPEGREQSRQRRLDPIQTPPRLPALPAGPAWQRRQAWIEERFWLKYFMTWTLM